MKSIRKSLVIKSATTLGLAAVMILTGLTTVQAAEDEAAVARGGKLYDKWFKVIDTKKPEGTHALYPKEGKKGKDSWRCKECHGWDYQGKDGAYAKGSHFSGIKGINGAKGKPVAEIVAILSDSKHGYGDKMAAADLNDLALFVSKGQVDMDMYIDRASKKTKGDVEAGKQKYNTVCAQCHGVKGDEPKEMSKTLGNNTSGNPWEALHKILNGQPAEKMPALRAMNRQDAVDILAYMQTLPQER